MAVTFRDYSGDLVEAAHSVLLELVRLLGEYRDDLVVVGGWVPQLILPAEPLKHVGSIDVDLAFNHRNLQDAGYATIQKLLLGRGYEQDHRQPFIFHRTVSVGGNPIKVQVDFLAGEYAGTAKAHRTQRVQEGRAGKARGCDLAFDLFVETEIRGELTGGGADQAIGSLKPTWLSSWTRRTARRRRGSGDGACLVGYRFPGDEGNGAA